MLRLVIDSDLHFANGMIRADKSNHEEVICGLVSPVDAIICAGDLTNSGTDGKKFMCWQYGGHDDQVAPLANFVKNISVYAPVYLCEGNHDQYVPWPYIHKGVRDYVIKRHGGRIYAWELAKGSNVYRFVCLGVYPDAKARAFLRRELENGIGKNFIIYFHYNVEGAWSDWWSDTDKSAFLATLAPYSSRIRLIIVGHRHANYMIKWYGYTVVSGAGSRVLICEIGDNGIRVQEV